MVCNRCIMVVEQILKEMKIPFSQISLGEVHLEKEPKPEQKKELSQRLKQLGFELIDDKKGRTIEKIKTLPIVTGKQIGRAHV